MDIPVYEPFSQYQTIPLGKILIKELQNTCM